MHDTARRREPSAPQVDDGDCTARQFAGGTTADPPAPLLGMRCTFLLRPSFRHCIILGLAFSGSRGFTPAALVAMLLYELLQIIDSHGEKSEPELPDGL
jgi:hypothetical protein